MTGNVSDRERWIERLRDAAIEATCTGASVEELVLAVREGVKEGRRLNALRAGTPTLDVPAPRPAGDAARPEYTPEPGSALARLLNAANI